MGVLQAFAGPTSPVRESDVETLRVEEGFEALANFSFVVDDQDRAFRHERLSWPREIPAGRTCPCRALSGLRLCRRAL